MMLWFAMISMTMTFAGLTSAYVVSSSRADWLTSFELPTVFLYSTILIFLSSITFFLGKKALNQENVSLTKNLSLGYTRSDTLVCLFSVHRIFTNHRTRLLLYWSSKFNHDLVSLCTCSPPSCPCFWRFDCSDGCSFSNL